MYPRINYEMTEEDLTTLLEACKPTRVMMIGNYIPPSPQDNANDAWAILGKKMGFDFMTVQHIAGKSHKFFSAIPTETKEQLAERTKREAEEVRLFKIKELEDEIVIKQAMLDKLKASI